MEKFNKLIAALLAAALMAGCSNLSTRKEIEQQKSKSAFDQPGDFHPTENHETPKRKKPKIAVVLGPGGFKTFAYPSFMKSLVQSGVMPDMVVGIEWGALTAGFFALNGKAHEAEWKIYKLEENKIQNSGFFKKGGAVKVDQLRGFLQENLGNKLEYQTQIQFRCPLIKLNNATLNWSSKGLLWQRLESCLASPPQFEPVTSEVPSLLSLGEVAENLKREGYDILVLVNVLGTSSTDLGKMNSWTETAYWAEVRRNIWADKGVFTDVIQIDTSQFRLFDFGAKTALQEVGDKAGREAAKSLVEKYQL